MHCFVVKSVLKQDFAAVKRVAIPGAHCNMQSAKLSSKLNLQILHCAALGLLKNIACLTELPCTQKPQMCTALSCRCADG